ncbi:putative regulator of chromosome condensation (RCC1) [Trypanosoma rangeli]|uniref:Putative regulator of chromosome condensation (RCC1) n=1 Tax=Trypanosoma rangeli TaxID=5698 RepID=A0A3R7P1Z6_TRYRA|nr:putative regulator of chromosome condensation (RCC1) [Trypanosoma rangeli]RNF11462.1 putative regulator of chromosome condensation (RCC1) [Trypanosoma rangeli]|eukprot:RNF11462.1 putative regulator of chromosome condensation (RCC1) [Trypanosoma rangeli]
MPFLATAGSNHYAQLGREGDTSFFEVLDIENDFVQVCCGARYTLALTRSGSVYGWGLNESGQLALPAPIVKRPTLINTCYNSRIVKVSCGESHSLFLTSSGEIYCCGDGSCGQRGDGTFHSKCFELSRALLNETTRDVFCGARTSFAITDDGDLFGWGETTSGMLGAKAWPTPTLSVPTRLSVGPPRTRIAWGVASRNFAIIITTKGEILGAGSNSDGQLGIADSCTYTWRPIRDVGRVSLVACGCRHTLCYQVEKKRCIVLSDQLGSFTLPNPTGLAAGEDNVFACIDGGRSLLVYGHNRNGQLGVGDIPNVEKLTQVSLPIKANVVMVSCGRKHTCLLLSGEEVHRGNYTVFMEDSATAEGDISRKTRTVTNWGRPSFGWECAATSVAALIVGVLVARFYGYQR